MAEQEEKRIIVKVAYNYFQSGKWDRALDEYKKLIAIDPMDFLVHTMLAEIYTHKGEVGEAIKEYIRAASLLAATNNMEKALKAYHRVLKLDPENQEARDKIEEVIRTRLVEVDDLIRRSQFKQAAEICERLDERAPNHLLIKEKIAEIEKRQKSAPQGSSAIRTGDTAEGDSRREDDPKRDEVVKNLYAMAEIYEKKQAWDEAVEAYITILRFQPNDKQAREKLHGLYRRITRTDKASDVWNRINEENKKIVERAKIISKEALPAPSPSVNPPQTAAPAPAGEPSTQMQRLSQDAEASLRQALENRRERDKSRSGGVPSKPGIREEQTEGVSDTESGGGDNVSAMITQAQMYISQNMLVEAMRICQRILEIDSQNLEVRSLLQKIFEKKKL